MVWSVSTGPFTFVIALLMVISGITSGATYSTFKDGNKVATAELETPGFTDFENLSIQHDTYVMKATFGVKGLASDLDPEAYPLEPMIKLNGTPIWSFIGEGYGQLGRQDQFLENGSTANMSFGPGGGNATAHLRLPKNATVKNATLYANSSGPVNHTQLLGLSTSAMGEEFGASLTGVGDVNNDGYDDVLVGSPDGWPSIPVDGRAYLYLGSADPVNEVYEIIHNPGMDDDAFGRSVAGAGDVNGDGYDDIVIGAPYNKSKGPYTGAAYIYFGGDYVDGNPDVVFYGANGTDYFGHSVAGVGDVNKDGFDDVLISAPWNTSVANRSGRAYLYLGGSSMDSVPDLLINGTIPNGNLGLTVTRAGDLNGDMIDDFALTSKQTYDPDGNLASGWVWVFLGGASLDGTYEFNLTSTGPKDGFGYNVAGGGDLNGDGYDDLAVSSNTIDYIYAMEPNGGYINIYNGGPVFDDKADLKITSGSTDITYVDLAIVGDFQNDSYDDLAASVFDSTFITPYMKLFSYNGGAPMDGTYDDYYWQFWGGGDWNIPCNTAGDINADGKDDMIFMIGASYFNQVYVITHEKGVKDPSLKIGDTTAWSSSGHTNDKQEIKDLPAKLNAYLLGASITGTDQKGNSYVDVPFTVTVEGQGNVTLEDLEVVYDHVAEVNDFSTILNDYIHTHQGEVDGIGNITIPLVISSSGPGKVLLNGLSLEIDEPPIMTETIPDLAIDEDSKRAMLFKPASKFTDDFETNLSFTVTSDADPSLVNLTMIQSGGETYLSADALTGTQNDNWTGTARATITAMDNHGLIATSNQFNVTVRNVNDPPVFTSTPVTMCQGGKTYEYNATAVDGDDDALAFSLLESPSGMSINPSTGGLRWIPTEGGNFTVTVQVADNVSSAKQEFSIFVPKMNMPPRFTSVPPTNATTGVAFDYRAKAVDDDNNPITYSLTSGPNGMTVHFITGQVTWTPRKDQIGNHTVTIMASDGKGGTAEQTFIVFVKDASSTVLGPSCTISSPLNGTKVGQGFTIKGTCKSGSSPVLKVEYRIDGGPWKTATGTDEWHAKVNGGLKNGKHTVEARGFDGTYYSSSVTTEFEYKSQGTSLGTNFLIWPILIIIIVCVVCVTLYIWKKNKKSQ